LTGGAVAVPTAGVVFVAVVLFAPAVGPISPNALYWSVSLEVGGTQLFGSDGCTKQHGRRWICQITDGQGSGSAAYDVVLEGDCWQARRTPGETSVEGSMAIRASDCVGLRDQVRLLERALSLLGARTRRLASGESAQCFEDFAAEVKWSVVRPIPTPG
jgi:hypothetical protein